MYSCLTMRSKARIKTVKEAAFSRFEGCLNTEMLKIRNLKLERVIIQVKIIEV